MDPVDPEPDRTEPAEPGETTHEVVPTGQPDPAALVARLIEAGEWPDPALVEQIVAAGESALGPLLDFMRTYPDPKDYGREIVLYRGIGILGAIGSPAAIPVLAEVIRRYPAESGESAAEVLGGFGAIAFEPAMELIRDPDVANYRRQNAINAARRAAGTDPALRARLAEVLRPMLADAMERTREEMKQYASEPEEDDEDEGEEFEGWTVEDLDEEDTFEDEDEGEEDLGEEDVEEPSEAAAVAAAAAEKPDETGEQTLEPHEEVMFLIGDLASLTDPEARDMIRTAFQEDLVETFWIDEKFVERLYREGGEKPHPSPDWVEDYREDYRRHIERQNRPPVSQRPSPMPSRASSYREPPYEPPPLQPPETIRNTGPKLGRNDPCWCGSGKKYKKCHFGKDNRA
jgi:hypothetical protein